MVDAEAADEQFDVGKADIGEDEVAGEEDEQQISHHEPPSQTQHEQSKTSLNMLDRSKGGDEEKTYDEQAPPKEAPSLSMHTPRPSSARSNRSVGAASLTATAATAATATALPLASSTNFEKSSAPARSKSARSARSATSLSTAASQFDLRSVNDMKYLGDQFKIGKPDPSLVPAHELRFQRVYEKQLKKWRATGSASSGSNDNSSSSSVNKHAETSRILSEFKRTRDPKVLADARFVHTNELKFAGDQFKVGKFDASVQSPCEKRFQDKCKSFLSKILPDPGRLPAKLSHAELKEMHTRLAVATNASSKS